MSHRWLKLALGRVCMQCGLTQADGAFDDDEPCHDDKPYTPQPEEPPKEPEPKT